MPSLHEMMTAIEKYQSVLNKDDIDGSIKITGVANLSAATKQKQNILMNSIKQMQELYYYLNNSSMKHGRLTLSVCMYWSKMLIWPMHALVHYSPLHA